MGVGDGVFNKGSPVHGGRTKPLSPTLSRRERENEESRDSRTHPERLLRQDLLKCWKLRIVPSGPVSLS